jgi:hypothetical protein
MDSRRGMGSASCRGEQCFVAVDVPHAPRNESGKPYDIVLLPELDSCVCAKRLIMLVKVVGPGNGDQGLASLASCNGLLTLVVLELGFSPEHHTPDILSLCRQLRLEGCNAGVAIDHLSSGECAEQNRGGAAVCGFA